MWKLFGVNHSALLHCEYTVGIVTEMRGLRHSWNILTLWAWIRVTLHMTKMLKQIISLYWSIFTCNFWCKKNGNLEPNSFLFCMLQSALEVCCQQYEEQQTKLCAALMLDATVIKSVLVFAFSLLSYRYM